ncbi:DGQHR domain-containing protein [Vibrio alginolyticus]|nr:DGQHR domain-containing protein [Vibrio alginolyticus]
MSDGYYYNFPAARGIQAGRPFFNVSIPMRTLTRILRIDGGDVLERSQRQVNNTRANKVAEYILDNPASYIIPCLTGVVEIPQGAEHPEFIGVGENECVGTLKVSMDCAVKLFDGQHRATGIAKALEVNPELASQSVAVLLYSNMTLAERKLAFADINQNVSKPAQSISDAYNSRDPLPILAVQIANELPCFKGCVDFERNSVSGKSEYIYSLKSIKDATATLLRVTPKVDDIHPDSRKLAKQFWNKISQELKWGGLHFGNLSPKQIREESIITHNVMLQAMAFAGTRMLDQYGDLESIPFEMLTKLDFSKQSADFARRCIQPETGKMISNATAIKLTAIKLLTAMDCPIEPELRVLEKQFFNLDKDSEVAA